MEIGSFIAVGIVCLKLLGQALDSLSAFLPAGAAVGAIFGFVFSQAMGGLIAGHAWEAWSKLRTFLCKVETHCWVPKTDLVQLLARYEDAEATIRNLVIENERLLDLTEIQQQKDLQE